MKINYKKGLACALLFAIVAVGFGTAALIPTPVSADLVDDLKDKSGKFGSDVGLPQQSTSDPVEFIAKIVTYLLGFLGVIFLVLVLYAGVLWMTAMGDPKKVDKAKGIIRTAAIGIVVIVLALVIVQFVLYILEQSVL